MQTPDFEREMRRMREAIAQMPPDQRAALEALAAETVARNAAIAVEAAAGQAAAERLDRAFASLREACARVAACTERLRGTLAAPARLPLPPEPGLN